MSTIIKKAVSEIIVPVRAGRHGIAPGEVPALAESIDEVGLLHPITVRKDGTLISGAKRLAAYKLLRRYRRDSSVLRHRQRRWRTFYVRILANLEQWQSRGEQSVNNLPI